MEEVMVVNYHDTSNYNIRPYTWLSLRANLAGFILDQILVQQGSLEMHYSINSYYLLARFDQKGSGKWQNITALDSNSHYPFLQPEDQVPAIH